jgi:hypothetical protein
MERNKSLPTFYYFAILLLILCIYLFTIYYFNSFYYFFIYFTILLLSNRKENTHRQRFLYSRGYTSTLMVVGLTHIDRDYSSSRIIAKWFCYVWKCPYLTWKLYLFIFFPWREINLSQRFTILLFYYFPFVYTYLLYII